MSKKKKQAEVQLQQPVVATLIPCYKQPHPKMQHAFAAMAQCAKEHGIQVYSQPIIQSSVVHWTRNSLLADLIKSGKPFTHVLWIDDDIVPEKDFLVRMLKHDVDIIGGLCTRRQDPPIPNARLWDKELKKYQELWEWPDGLVEVGAVGTGMMLMSLNAVQMVAEVWFQCLVERDIYGMSEEQAKEWTANRLKAFDADANAWWFQFPVIPGGVGEFGEDIGFCWKATNYAGLKVHVDTTIQPEHMGDYGYSIKDFLYHREPVIEKAKRNGTYLNPPSLLKAQDSGIVVVD